ncbi:MAG: PAS domain-containing protein, partial [Flavobacteriaceae bacterium]|nr:PAS domain-containing protein [Flavobacteriaceae bacterium]
MNAFKPTIEKLPEGHPVKVYYKESQLIQDLLLELHDADPLLDFQKYYNVFNQLSTIEKRFARKENQLFPYLEKHGWEGPSQGMWSFHDNLRDQIRLLNTYNSEKKTTKIIENIPYLIAGIKRLLSIEDARLFPNAMDLLSEDDWKEFYIGDEEIGWMLTEKPSPYPAQKEAAYVHPADDTKKRALTFSTENTFHLDEGYMTPEQVNLLLRFLPLDITYVDENDKVIFYNRGDDRVFPRSKGIIGREVKFCHPPKSVHMVIQIVEEFKAGNRD